ncbi:hypothetical protein KAH81_08305 [bacterium]|nr:hypothetical protein [bacterium]
MKKSFVLLAMLLIAVPIIAYTYWFDGNLEYVGSMKVCNCIGIPLDCKCGIAEQQPEPGWYRGTLQQVDKDGTHWIMCDNNPQGEYWCYFEQ